MLTKCPECGHDVSDKAEFCPNCGFVFRKPRKYNKRRRLPNGFGQISEIKGSHLRKPFRAMVTVGTNENGRPIQKLLKPVSYFSTYNEAYEALLKYNQNPYSLSKAVTMEDLYKEWSEYYFSKARSKSVKATYATAWPYASTMSSVPVHEIRVRHLRTCIDSASIKRKDQVISASPATKNRMKLLFNLMFDFAVEKEYTDKNYARDLHYGGDLSREMEEQRVGHKPYTDDEMEKLWQSVSENGFSDVILIQCYTGFRPQELAKIKVIDVDLEQNIIKGGLKTTAGRDRLVPIHPRIRDFVVRRYEEAISCGSEYLLNVKVNGEWLNLTYDRLNYRFKNIVTDLDLKGHRLHDGRAHFVTMAKKYNMDEYALKRIVGHAITDLTERVYTQRDIEWLKSEMSKIL